jgi:TRAP-type C4-dicarboxylate transport system permease small subunit
MNTEPQAAEKDSAGLFRLLGWLSALPVALILILTFADVLARYIFAAPIRGNVELIEFAMALVIFTALPLVTRQREHVTVSLVDGFFKDTGRRIKTMLCDAVSAVALGLMTWRLALQGMEDLASETATIVLGMPHAPLSFALTALAGVSTLIMLVLIWNTLTNPGAAK